jgi:hypothetical protein
MSLNFIVGVVRRGWLIYGSCHAFHASGRVERVEMDARNTVSHQVEALGLAPFNTHLLGIVVVLAFHKFRHKLHGHVDMEYLGKNV